MPALPSEKEFQLSSTAFFGRTFSEYLEFFPLRPEEWQDRRVLDVAAGPSAFTAEAHVRGIRAVAVDPLYGYPPATLATYVQMDYTRVLAEMRRKESLMLYQRFPTIAAAEESRRSAAARFLADYETGFLHGRYLGAALPRLPFPDGCFDLVLCAHLLFIYARLFDLPWHLAACRELVRVSRGPVWIHPLCGPDGQAYAGLEGLRAGLSDEGIRSESIPVAQGIFAGTDTTLLLSRPPG